MDNAEPGPKCRALFFALLVNWPVFGYDPALAQRTFVTATMDPAR